MNMTNKKLTAIIGFILATSCTIAAAGTTERVSVTSTGGQLINHTMDGFDLSSNGRYVLFTTAEKIVPEDTNTYSDVHLLDRATKIVKRISVGPNNLQANGHSSADKQSISADGRYIVFQSYASNLTTGAPPSGFIHTYVYDRVAGTNEIIDVSSTGAMANGATSKATISADGRFVAFSSTASNLVVNDTNGLGDVFLRDRNNKTTVLVSISTNNIQANDHSSTQYDYAPSVSADGRYVVFTTRATNLVPGDTNNFDVFVRDIVAGTTKRVSNGISGAQPNGESGSGRISSDGHYVLFASSASNIIANDTNNSSDLFMFDLVANSYERVNISAAGAQANAGASYAAISQDGRFIAYNTTATNILNDGGPGGHVPVIYDRLNRVVERVSVSSTGQLVGDAGGMTPSISADGKIVAFSTYSGQLVPNDTNNKYDVFVRDRVGLTCP